MDWISVEDRMPEDGTKCLVFAPQVRHDVPSFMAVMTWTKFKGWWPGVGDRISHWMKAPATPIG